MEGGDVAPMSIIVQSNQYHVCCAMCCSVQVQTRRDTYLLVPAYDETRARRLRWGRRGGLRARLLLRHRRAINGVEGWVFSRKRLLLLTKRCEAGTESQFAGCGADFIRGAGT
jgi:hypothetical protein